MPVSKFEAFNVAAEADDATPSMTETQVKHWLSGPKKRDGVRAYQIAPIHVGMCHPPQSEAVQRDLLEYFALNGITRSAVTRLPYRSISCGARTRPTPRWRPSGRAPVRSASL
ncbi:unnamed protein product [Durusdinium trenchii]|uniref:Uncharacterized protein n=1 Tax=Durusdinium trenchii TaxID=1381693 RepID=A0ABP0SCF7_9DINO